MIKKMMLTMVALATMTVAMAQNDFNGDNNKSGRKPFTVKQHTEIMAEVLKLSDDQKAQLLSLNEAYKDVISRPGRRGGRPKMDNTSNSEQQRPEMTEEMKAKMKEMKEKRQEYDTKLKSILTESQYKTYQEMHQKRGGKNHDKRNDA